MVAEVDALLACVVAVDADPEAEVAEAPSSTDMFGREREGRRDSYTDMFGRTTTPEDDGTRPATQAATHTDMFGQETLPDEGEYHENGGLGNSTKPPAGSS